MRIHLRWAVASICGALVLVALAPAGAHVGNEVDHLWRRHLTTRLSSLPGCPAEMALNDFVGSAAPVCEGVDVFSGHHDDAIVVPAQEPSEVASLPLDAGAYMITAKAIVGAPAAGNPQNRAVRCILEAGGDADEARAVTDATHAWDTIGMTVVHEFSSPGEAVLRCGYVEAGTNQKPVSHIKITAVRVADVQNSAI